MMDKDTDLKLEAAYLAGFQASGEGYNGEYPFGDHNRNPEHDPVWCKDRDNKITAIKQSCSAPVQEPMTQDEIIEMAIQGHASTRDAIRWAIKQALAAPTSADYAMGYAEGFNDGCKPAPVQQEPVAWQDTAKPSEIVDSENWDNIDPQWHWMYRPLYTTPLAAQRTWVGLTDKERYELLDKAYNPESYAVLVEAKLKEKNT
jgi:hypothetical protein